MQYAAIINSNNKGVSMKRAGHVLMHAFFVCKNTKNDSKKKNLFRIAHTQKSGIQLLDSMECVVEFSKRSPKKC